MSLRAAAIAASAVFLSSGAGLGSDGNGFSGTVKTSNRDRQDNVTGTGTSPLAGRRIQAQPF